MMPDIKIPILEKDHEWNIHKDKLQEESKELAVAIDILDFVEKHEITRFKEPAVAARHVIAESLDNIQISIGIIEKVLETYPSILNDSVIEHVEKLYDRGWKFRKMVRITEE